MACQASAGDGIETGGETHFLKTCSPSADACGTELACECGVCTLACDDSRACASLPGATCVEANVDSLCGALASPRCDLPCEEDTDCQVVSSFHVCDRGLCRTQGPVPTSTESVAPDMTPTESVAPDTTQNEADASGTSDQGSSDVPVDSGMQCHATDLPPNELLIIGDSFFANTHQVTAYLEGLARAASVLAEGERYRDASSVVTNTYVVAGNGIEQQFVSAVGEGPVQVVVMNGGGADALLSMCDPPDETCEPLQEAVVAAASLFELMAQSGVHSVVYAFYPDPSIEVFKAKLDVMRPLIQGACENAPLNCHWVDLRPVFANRADYVGFDGALPSDAGSRATAEAIWEVMTAECIAR